MDSTERGDWDTFGKCINSYWYQKKQMGHGAEPPEVLLFNVHMSFAFVMETLQVARILSALRSVCDAVALCGAGGGGFAYGFLKGETYSYLSVCICFIFCVYLARQMAPAFLT